MKIIIKLGIVVLFSLISQCAVALHFETKIINKTNQAFTIHCEDYQCAYCAADTMIQLGQAISYWTGYNSAGTNIFDHCYWDSTVAFLHFTNSNGSEEYKVELHGSNSSEIGHGDTWESELTYMLTIKGKNSLSLFCKAGGDINNESNSSITLGDTKAENNC